jgi:uncharacterized protein YhaN
MRLLALDLLRYGHLTDATLRFPEAAGLHVVLGANEAGKSTALSAIGDALFGFPHRTDHAFLHDANQLRIGFELVARDGSRAAFRRRKGRQNTLLDAEENGVPDGALQRFLGGATRDLFEKAFGLNAARLRDGAQSLIEGGGAAAEGLLAGMGVPHLRRALERLDKAADDLQGSRHKVRKLPAALDAWQQAQRNLDAATVRPKEWSDAIEAREKTTRELAAIATEAEELKREELRLRRARAVRQPLAALAALRAELTALDGAPALPDDAADRLARAVAALEKAEQDEAREEEAAARQDAERAALPSDPAILARQEAVDRLGQLAATASAAEKDLPEVRQAAATQRHRIAEAAARLGLEMAPEAVVAALPQERHRRDAQRLIRGHTALLTKMQTAQEALRQAERRHARAVEALAAAPAPLHAAPLRRAMEAARGEGRLDQELGTAERELADAERRVATALAALPLWSGDAAALGACALPLAASCEDTSARLDQAGAALEAARRALEAIRAEIATLAARQDELARGGEVPTAEVIAAARARRDESWEAIRRQLDGTEAPDAARADAFEALRDAADRLADARAEDAERVSDYAACTARLVALRAELAAAEQREAEAAAALATAEDAWRGLWAPSGLAAGRPAEMREWRAARDRVLELAEKAAAQRRARDGLAARRAAAMALLAAQLSPPHATTLAGLLAAAEDALAALDAAEEAHRRLRDAAAAAATTLEEARGLAADAAAVLEAGAEAWRPAVTLLGLAESAGPKQVEAALQDWSVVAEAASAWRAATARIEQMEAALGVLAQEAAALAEVLGEAMRGEAPAVTALRLARRLKDARETEIKAGAFATEAGNRRQAAAAARAARQEAEAALGRLHALAGTADLPALRDAVACAARRAELQRLVAAEEARLRDQADGVAEDVLRVELDGFDADGAAARIEAIEQRQQELNEARTRLGAERQRVQSALEGLEAGRDAAAFAQDARNALAEAQAAAERYARLHAARTVLRAGIEKLRQSQQGPMLQAATRHFALLTGGRYVRLVTEEEEDGTPLLRAVRADGATCPMDQLSEGARDQLYLALRVAALEIQAEAAEPLPFVADDLLASFDEARADAALRLLAGLGARVQVILFTHHAHVAELAARVPEAAVLRLGAEAPMAAALPAA